MSSESEKQMRDRFESWLPTYLRTDLIPTFANRGDDGTYRHAQVEDMWQGWKAAMSSRVEPEEAAG